MRQGQPGSDLYLVLDGVIRVDRDGAQPAVLLLQHRPDRTDSEPELAAGLHDTAVPVALAADGEVSCL